MSGEALITKTREFPLVKLAPDVPCRFMLEQCNPLLPLQWAIPSPIGRTFPTHSHVLLQKLNKE